MYNQHKWRLGIFRGLNHSLIKNGHYDEKFISKYTDGFENYKNSITVLIGKKLSQLVAFHATK